MKYLVEAIKSFSLPAIANEIRILLVPKNEYGFPMVRSERGWVEPLAFGNHNWEDVKTPLTMPILREWVKTLRSGEYTQAHGYLRDNGHCCLGVLADSRDQLSACDITDRFVFDVDSNMNGTDSLLSATDKNTDGYKYIYFYLPGSLQSELAEMNDDGSSFLEIANELEVLFGIKEKRSEDQLV